MSPVQITLYSLLGIGILACIIALFYTKLIKPNTFGYTNKNVFIKKEYSDLIKKLNSNSKVWNYDDLHLIFDNNESKPIIIEKMFVTLQNVYVLSKPIEKKVLDITKESNDFKLLYKKKKLDLPLDINLLIVNSKLLKQKTKIGKNLKIIIPVSNDSFEYKDFDNIYFINQNELLEKIQHIEKLPSEFDYKMFIELINKSMKKKKPKRTFMNIRFKKEHENN